MPVIVAIPPPPSLQASLRRVLLRRQLCVPPMARKGRARQRQTRARAWPCPRARGANALPCPPSATRASRPQSCRLPSSRATRDSQATQRSLHLHTVCRVFSAVSLAHLCKHQAQQQAPPARHGVVVLVVTCRFMPCGPRARHTRNSIKHTDVTDSIKDTYGTAGLPCGPRAWHHGKPLLDRDVALLHGATVWLLFHS